nr:hypothetical protein [Paraburkholderia sp. NMBU_R16]
MHYVLLFLAGAFLCNSIPHLTAGLQGTPFPTPFARPRRSGRSSASVNFLWGSFNLGLGAVMISGDPPAVGANAECLALALGALILGPLLNSEWVMLAGQGRA